MKWHAVSADETLQILKVDEKRGLDPFEVEKRFIQYGKNTLPEGEKTSLLKVFFHQFKSPLIYLLFISAVAAFFMKEFGDGMVILFVVTINSVIGTFQEARAEKSMKDLRKVTQVSVRTLRDGKEEILPASELVPGDIVLFNAGDMVPADIRLLGAYSLKASEAVLTGESVPVEKSNQKVAEKSVLGERSNLLFSGTYITSGRARGVVVATGVATELGKIAELTGSVEEPPTPLSLRIAQFSRYLIYAAVIVFCLIVVLGFLQGTTMAEIIMIGISQMVSMVPEGLPVAITVAAAVGIQRMAAKKTIVRKLSAVETLGSITVICSDKTGTLTLNKMTVTEARLWPEKKINMEGDFKAHHEELRELLKIAVLCNDSKVEGDKHLGDPTETSLLAAAEHLGIKKTECEEEYPRVKEIPFDSQIKMMATDSVLLLCDLDEAARDEINKMNEEMASSALRVLAFAKASGSSLEGDMSSLKGKAQFLGLLGQMDPPREEAREAIEACRRAGIRPVMITGDHKTTGFAIAKMIGLAQEGDRAVEGRELDESLNDIDDIVVFARVHPSQKLALVGAFQKAGHVVAMTGDGVNDAPALGKADVGVAMGITGTEVAKEASKIIVTDDNFSTIVTAIAEGRLVYQNIKKVILLLFSTSLAEVCVILLALICGFPAPYAAVQILWNNLVTEGVITVNLIMEPYEGNEMERKPISRNEPLITRMMFKRMLFIVPTMIACIFGWYLMRIKSGIGLDLVRTETLTMIVVCEWFNVINCRSETKSGLSLSILKNKWLLGGLIVGNILHVLVVFWRPLGNYFHTVPIDLYILPQIILIGSLVLWVEELRKYFIRRKP